MTTPDADAVATLAAITGQSSEEAALLLEATGGDVEAAVAIHFDERGQEAQPADEAPPDASGEAHGEELPPQPSRVGAAAPTTWQPAPTGETFRRRLLVGADADRQLKDDEHRPHHLLQWKSQPAAGQWPVELSIQNKTAESVEVLWIDWQAEPQSYGVVAPGASFRQTTHAEHAWLVRRPEGAGASLCVYMPKRSDQRVHALALVAADPPAVEEAAVPAPGAMASVLRFVRLLFSTEGAILVGLVAALYLLR